MNNFKFRTTLIMILDWERPAGVFEINVDSSFLACESRGGVGTAIRQHAWDLCGCNGKAIFSLVICYSCWPWQRGKSSSLQRSYFTSKSFRSATWIISSKLIKGQVDLVRTESNKVSYKEKLHLQALVFEGNLLGVANAN